MLIINLGTPIAITVNMLFWLLISEGLFRFWISRAESVRERLDRQQTKTRAWDRRWRWALIALVILASVTR
jgi:hypothetical protein